MTEKEAFYNKLKIQLEETTNFPSDYMFKFILPSKENQQEEIKKIFNSNGPVIRTRKSKNGKYISVSIVIKLNSAEEIISYYKKAETIEGIISL